MISATGDKVIVNVLKREKSAGGIFMPSTSQEPQAYGKVISVGEDVKTFVPGSYVVFHNRAGMDIMFEKQLMKVLKYEEIYGFLTDEEFIKQLGEKTIES